MATNQNYIAITIKAALPTGKTLDEQFAALSIVKQAHETGDYSALLAAAQDVEIKTEAKTRCVETVEIAGKSPEPVEPVEPAPVFDDEPHTKVTTEADPAPVNLETQPAPKPRRAAAVAE